MVDFPILPLTAPEPRLVDGDALSLGNACEAPDAEAKAGLSSDPIIRVGMGTVPRELAIASIRRASAHRHTDLEAALQLSAPLRVGPYLDALRGFDLFLSRWEPRIEAALPADLHRWFASCSRRGLLQRDIDRLHIGHPPPDEVTRACAQAIDEIELPNVAATFGSLYVLEGSALGGQVLATMARATLGLNADNGAAYFNGCGRHTAAAWRAFQGLLEDHVGADPTARRQACRAALQTFDALITTFTSRRRRHVTA